MTNKAIEINKTIIGIIDLYHTDLNDYKAQVGLPFVDYLRYGGLQMRFFLEYISLEPYLSDTNDTIVVKDIIQINNIKDTVFLNMIITFLMDNIGNPFFTRSIVGVLKPDDINTTVGTIISNIDYIKMAMVVYSLQRYDIKKSFLQRMRNIIPSI